MKLPFMSLHIVSSKTLEDQEEKIDAYETILSGSVPELEQVALALHELKAGGSSHTRRKSGRALDRKIRKLSRAIAIDIGLE